MTTQVRVWGLGVMACVLGSGNVAAQPLGVFRWQLSPYCNVVNLTVTQVGAIYRIEGVDDQCGAPTAAAVTGTAFLNVNGTIGLGFNIVASPGGDLVAVDATIALATLGGSWRDSTGRDGAFVFTPGAGSGGSPRPVGVEAVIPSGRTVIGTRHWRHPVGADNDQYQIDVILPALAPVPLSLDKVNFAPHALASDGDASCTGTALAPTAPPGKVCIYLRSGSLVKGLGGFVFALPDRSFYVNLSTNLAFGPFMEVVFTWAYTAPR